MKRIPLLTLALAAAASASAQSYDGPYYLPGDGMYYVGMPSTMKAALSEPTIVTQAYQSRLRLGNAELASIKAGASSYNVTSRIDDDANGGMLDLVSFMGIGSAYDLTVRDMEGGSYQLGDLAPKKTWYNTRLLAAQPRWRGHETLPLAVYNQWDCPLTTEADPHLQSGYDAVTVDFGNPHEGLVLKYINFPLVKSPACDPEMEISIVFTVWDADHKEVTATYEKAVAVADLPFVKQDGDNEIVSFMVPFSKPLVVSTPFDVTLSGLAGGDQIWLLRAVDSHGIFPSHTTYSSYLGDDDTAAETLVDASSNAVINVDGYFNYIGTWGWWDGKYERGEVVGSADLVQIYYDPASPDWPGDYFMGEAAFPLESTFGSGDITIDEMPSWINNVSYDDSQWDEYGCVQISLYADALPKGETGRNGKVVLVTADGASYYTIYLRQGGAWFDMGDQEGIDSPLAPEALAPSTTLTFDLQGRCISQPRQGQPYISGGKVRVF